MSQQIAIQKQDFIEVCNKIITAFKNGDLGQTAMPEDTHPKFSNKEERISYFTLPMALNYQRDSYKLWEAAKKTFEDPETSFVFDVEKVGRAPEEEIRKALMKYKVALQPNKHVNTWRRIAETIYQNWGSFAKFFEENDNDFLKIKETVKIDYKKDFPYLSGPKIFNYWSFIMSTYGEVNLSNRDYIEIAPDTHITQCSVKLGVISQDEADSLTKDAISEKWRILLQGSGIDPIDMHSPLWFWSRNGFLFKHA